MQYRIKEQASRTRAIFRQCLPDRTWATEPVNGPKYQMTLNINYLDGTNIRQPSPKGAGPGAQDMYSIFNTDELVRVNGALAEFREGMIHLREGTERQRVTDTGVSVTSSKNDKNNNGVSKGHVHSIDSFRTSITILQAPPPPACDLFSRKKL